MWEIKYKLGSILKLSFKCVFQNSRAVSFQLPRQSRNFKHHESTTNHYLLDGYDVGEHISKQEKKREHGGGGGEEKKEGTRQP